MDKGIWRVARARLCVACLQEMAADYIIEQRSTAGCMACASAAEKSRK